MSSTVASSSTCCCNQLGAWLRQPSAANRPIFAVCQISMAIRADQPGLSDQMVGGSDQFVLLFDAVSRRFGLDSSMISLAEGGSRSATIGSCSGGARNQKKPLWARRWWISGEDRRNHRRPRPPNAFCIAEFRRP